MTRAAAMALAAVIVVACERQAGPDDTLPAARLPAPEVLEHGRDLALGWLVTQQQPDGAFVLDRDRKLDVWNTIVALWAMRGRGPPAASVTAWRFVDASVREDGVAFHSRNRGTSQACTETTSLLYATLDRPTRFAPAAACELVAASALEDGHVRVNTPVAIIPPELQTYPSVAGFALLGTQGCAGLPAATRRAVTTYAEEAFANPERLARPWQYYGTEYYALAALAWGLEAAHALPPTSDAPPVVAYIRRLQRADGAILNGGPSALSQTTVELHTLLALHALVTVRNAPGAEALIARGVGFVAAQQRADGSVPGGTFVGKAARQDLFASALWVALIDRLRPVPAAAPQGVAPPSP